MKHCLTCHPEKSLCESPVAVIQRWSTALSAYDYDVPHSAKQILHVDYLSKYVQSLDSRDLDSLPVQPLPFACQDLACESCQWFLQFYRLSNEDGMQIINEILQLTFQNRETSCYFSGNSVFKQPRRNSPSLEPPILSELHPSYLGVEMMEPLTSLTCWWPDMDNGFWRVSKIFVNGVNIVNF